MEWYFILIYRRPIKVIAIVRARATFLILLSISILNEKWLEILCRRNELTLIIARCLRLSLFVLSRGIVKRTN